MTRPNVENERKLQILDAAMRCFSRKGYRLCSMDDIAAELPFSKALIYYYFKTKRDVFLAIMGDWERRTTETWEASLSSDDTARTRLRKSLEYSVHLIVEFKELARVQFEFFAETGRDDDVRRAVQRLFANFREEFKVTLEAGIANGEFRPMDTEALSAALLGIYEGLAMQGIVDETLDWPSIHKSLLEMITSGISTKRQEMSP